MNSHSPSHVMTAVLVLLENLADATGFFVIILDGVSGGVVTSIDTQTDV